MAVALPSLRSTIPITPWSPCCFWSAGSSACSKYCRASSIRSGGNPAILLIRACMSLLPLLGGRLTAPFFDRLSELIEHLGRAPAQALDVPVRQGQEPHVALGNDRGVALPLRQHTHLAEEVPGSEIGDVIAVARHLGLPVLDHEQVVRVVALVDEVLAARHLELVDPNGELAPRVVGQRGEERYRLQAFSVHVPPSLCIAPRDSPRSPSGVYAPTGAAVEPDDTFSRSACLEVPARQGIDCRRASPKRRTEPRDQEVVMRKVLVAAGVASAVIAIGAMSAGASGGHRSPLQVKVPGEDRFAPFAVTIHTGDSVQWKNNDTDDHTVVSDDTFNTAGNRGVNRLLPSGGTVTLRFTHPGTFVYYCRFHAHLDGASQPVAPGPEGGIQDSNGNFGTPMSGEVTVLPGKRSGH